MLCYESNAMRPKTMYFNLMKCNNMSGHVRLSIVIVCFAILGMFLCTSSNVLEWFVMFVLLSKVMQWYVMV